MVLYLLMVALFGVGAISFFVWGFRKSHDVRGYRSAAESQYLIAAIFFVAVVGTLIGLGAGRASAIGHYTKLESFAHYTMQGYTYTITKTGEIVLQGEKITNPNSVTDLGYIKLAEMSADRIRELRDAVTWYDEDLIWYQRATSLPFVGAFYPTVPADLKPIILGG